MQPDGVVIAAWPTAGEVYNFPELRTELRGHGHEFRTSTDTDDLRETLT
jgi:asparagine synthase (glutamine-hydrolysing)